MFGKNAKWIALIGGGVIWVFFIMVFTYMFFTKMRF